MTNNATTANWTGGTNAGLTRIGPFGEMLQYGTNWFLLSFTNGNGLSYTNPAGDVAGILTATGRVVLATATTPVIGLPLVAQTIGGEVAFSNSLSSAIVSYPTNWIPLGGTVALDNTVKNAQTNASFTITGWTGTSQTANQMVSLTVSNSNASSIVVTFPGGIHFLAGTSPYTITNGSAALILIQQHPSYTNGWFEPWLN